MSRTFRRINIETTQGSSHRRQGSKIALAYTEYDLEYEERGIGHRWMKAHRQPTPKEAFKRFRDNHLDAGTSPNPGAYGSCLQRFGKRTENRKDRLRHRAKIVRFLKGRDDDVVMESRWIKPYMYW